MGACRGITGSRGVSFTGAPKLRAAVVEPGDRAGGARSDWEATRSGVRDAGRSAPAPARSGARSLLREREGLSGDITAACAGAESGACGESLESSAARSIDLAR